jgi:hypothetical protein
VNKTLDEPGEVNIRRVRSARVRMQRAELGSVEWNEAREEEQRALEGLRREFGVLDQQSIDWLVERPLRR